MIHFQIISYLLILMILVLCIINIDKAFYLYLSSTFLRLSNFYGIPRLFSPLIFDLLILLILFINYKKYMRFNTIISYSKIFLIWVFSHIIIRFLHSLFYSKMSLIQASSDIIGFYFQLAILYFVIIGYMEKNKSFSKINKALFINLIFLALLIYVEFFFGLSYNYLFGIKEIVPSFIKEIQPGRYGRVLIAGPAGQWVATGTLLMSYISVIFYYLFLSEKKPNNIKSVTTILLTLTTITIIGARSPLISLIFILFYFLFFLKIKRKFIFSILTIVITSVYLQYTGVFNYLISSLTTTGTSNVEFYRRIFVSIILFQDILSVPAIGYGFLGRKHESIENLEFQDLMEVNIFLWETYDFGLIVGIITLIFYVLSVKNCIKAFKYTNHIGALSFIAIFICSLSNGVQEYIFYVVPIILLGLSNWKIHYRFLLLNNRVFSYHE